MINNMKSRLIASPCALAAALFAFTFAFGSAQASAEDLETISCSLQTADALDYSVELAEEIDVVCHSSAAEAQPLETAHVDLGTPAEADNAPSAIVATQQPTADESFPTAPPAPLAVEGQASDESSPSAPSAPLAVEGQASEESSPSTPSAPLAIEGQAIPVEVTQSVTVAVLGQIDDDADAADVTGSVPPAAETNEAPQLDPQVLDPAE